MHLRPPTQALGAHLDPKPKPWRCTQTPNLGDALKTPNPNLGGALKTPNPNLGGALGPQTLGSHLDPKTWGCTQTPNHGDALRPQTQTLWLHSDPKPWRCTQTPNPLHNTQGPKSGTQGPLGSQWFRSPSIGVLGSPVALWGWDLSLLLIRAALLRKDLCLVAVHREFGVNKKNLSCPAGRLPALS